MPSDVTHDVTLRQVIPYCRQRGSRLWWALKRHSSGLRARSSWSPPCCVEPWINQAHKGYIHACV